MMKTEFLPRLVFVLVMCLLVWEWAEPQRSSPVRDSPLSIPPSIKETKSLGTSRKNECGLVQGAKAGEVVFLSGQLGLDEKGTVVGKGSMDAQMRQGYANIAKVLQQFTRTVNDVLEETIYITDMPLDLTTGPKVRREVYAEHPAVASTLVQIQRLAFADALVEIRSVAKASQIGSPRSSARNPMNFREAEAGVAGWAAEEQEERRSAKARATTEQGGWV
jgi:enamine deaminase RidA (YjgF/YER057c/UK114 family)